MFLGLIVVGCRGDSPSDRSAAFMESRDSAGVTIRVDARSVEDLPRLREASGPSVVLGDDENDENELFAEVGPIVAHPENGIAIADPRSADIRRFDWDGAYLGSTGGPGEGPGEFDNITSLQGGESIRVWDWGRRRLTEFEWDGSLTGDTKVSPAGMPWGGVVASTDAGLVAVGRHVLDTPPTEGDFYLRHDSLDVELLDQSGEATGNIGRLAADERVHVRKESPGGIVIVSDLLRPLGDRLFLDAADERILIARGRAGEIRFVSSDGTVEEIWHFPGLSEPATAELLTRWADLRADEVADREVADLRGALEAFPPSEIPAFVDLLVTPDGGLWLGTPLLGTSRRWVVVSRDGSLQSYVDLPRELNVRAVTSDKVVGVVTDTMGVAQVWFYDLRLASNSS